MFPIKDTRHRGVEDRMERRTSEKPYWAVLGRCEQKKEHVGTLVATRISTGAKKERTTRNEQPGTNRTEHQAQHGQTKAKGSRRRKMAESIHTIIKNKRFVVNHQGNDLETPISSFFDGIENLTNLGDIKAWLNGKTEEEQLAFYHYGFDSAVIKNRAVCRPNLRTYGKKDDFDTALRLLDVSGDRGRYHVSESKQTITMNILRDPDAVERSLGWIPKPKMVPGSSSGKGFVKGEENALGMSIEAMRSVGMADDVIVGALAAKFDRAKIERVLAGLGSGSDDTSN